MKCPMCGFIFDENAVNTTCEACIMHKGCNLKRCPNCNYEILPESKLITTIKKLFKKGDK